jgi:hypothetical protein
VSSCICIFLAWDEPRQRLVRRLLSLGVPVLVFVVTAGRDGPGARLEAGPLRERPGCFHELAVGRIAEGLARL